MGKRIGFLLTSTALIAYGCGSEGSGGSKSATSGGTGANGSGGVAASGGAGAAPGGGGASGAGAAGASGAGGGGASGGAAGSGAGGGTGGGGGAAGSDGGNPDATAPELCDGIDNDGDGVVDDAPTGAPTCSALGVCAGASAVCNGSAGWKCSYPSSHEPKEATCTDSLDNDCDGKTDELDDCVCTGNGTLGVPCDHTADLDQCKNGDLWCTSGTPQCVGDFGFTTSMGCYTGGGYTVSKYAPGCPGAVGNPELHVYGIYTTGGSGSPKNHSVSIKRKAAPMVVVLSAYEAINWILTIEPGAVVQQIIATGFKTPTVTNAGTIPVLIKSGSSAYTVAAFKWPSAEATALVGAAEQQTGLKLSSFTGCYQSTSYSILDVP